MSKAQRSRRSQRTDMENERAHLAAAVVAIGLVVAGISYAMSNGWAPACGNDNPHPAMQCKRGADHTLTVFDAALA